MGKTYKVVLNSSIPAAAGGNNNNNQPYFYDWTKLEQGKYKCSFTYVGCIRNNLNINNVPIVCIDLGQSDVYFARGTNTLSTPSLPNYIGALATNNMDFTPDPDNAYWCATLETNPPIYLQKRPPNNSFVVNIRQNANPSLIFNPDLIGNYTLTLYLEKLD
jgi:hypothetical protein